MEDGNCILTGTTAWEGQQQPDEAGRTNVMYQLGTVQTRDSPSQQRMVHGDAEGVADTRNLSLDAALFPFLHPGGRGAFRSGHSLSNLLQQRIQQLFSPYTLVKEYLLVMFQVRCSLCPLHQANATP